MPKDTLELAREHTREFVRGVDMGKFIANLHITKPLSSNPERDAIQDAGTALFVTLSRHPFICADDINALLVGLSEGVEVAFQQTREDLHYEPKS